MSERLYRIGPFGGVAMPESFELDQGWAGNDHLAEVIQLPRRRSLFGFARALVEAPLAPTAPAAPASHRFRTAVTFRRLWPGERTADETVEVDEAVTAEPTWRATLVFRRGTVVAATVATPVVPVPTVAEPLEEDGPIGTILVRAAADDTAWEEPEISEPSNIESTTPTYDLDDEVELLDSTTEPEPEHHEPEHHEPEVIVEPEIVIPAEPEVVPVLSEQIVVEEAKPSKQGRTRKPKRQRGGGQQNGQRRLVGLKIGASQLAAAVVVNDGVPEVQQLARTPFETGIVVDGEVRDEDALASAMQRFFAEAKLPTRDVRIGLSSNRIGVRTLEIAGVDDQERFDNAVRFKAHEVLPISVNESVLDYRVLSERPGEGDEIIRRVLLVVAPRDQVDPYVGAARKAGIKLHGIDLESFALLRTFVEPRPVGDGNEQAAIVVVSIGHESTTLVVSGAGVCEFTRVFGWGGGSLDAAISAACSLSPAEANALKSRLSLDGPLPADVDAALASRALEAVRTEMTLFARELVSSLQYYQKQQDSLGIGEVVVTGGTTHLGGLAASLHTLVGVPVRTGDPLARVVAAKGVASDPTVADTIGSLAIAIGLGIDDDPMRAVNLLPSDAQLSGRRMPSRNQILIPAALAVPVVALAALFLPAHSSVGMKQSEVESLNAELATLPEPSAPGIDSTIQGEQARRAAVVADVLSKRIAWDRVLRDLGMVMPADVWLTNLKAAVPQPLSVPPIPVSATTTSPPPVAPVLTSTGVTITGRTYSQAGVARMLARLATVPSLSGIQLTRSAQLALGKRTVYEFEIVASMRGAGEAS